MLEIKDPLVGLAYVLSIGSAILCVVYGFFCWNRGDDSVQTEDMRWAAHEKREMEEEK